MHSDSEGLGGPEVIFAWHVPSDAEAARMRTMLRAPAIYELKVGLVAIYSVAFLIPVREQERWKEMGDGVRRPLFYLSRISK